MYCELLTSLCILHYTNRSIHTSVGVSTVSLAYKEDADPTSSKDMVISLLVYVYDGVGICC